MLRLPFRHPFFLSRGAAVWHHEMRRCVVFEVSQRVFTDSAQDVIQDLVRIMGRWFVADVRPIQVVDRFSNGAPFRRTVGRRYYLYRKDNPMVPLRCDNNGRYYCLLPRLDVTIHRNRGGSTRVEEQITGWSFFPVGVCYE